MPYLFFQSTHSSLIIPEQHLVKARNTQALACILKNRIIADMHKVIVIVGTNASGKSNLAVSLAKQFNGEIISADSRQVYKGLDIATGKITPEEMDGVPHHLIDIADPKTTYTAADFARDGRQALEDILERGKLPIIAGGTGFYIDALLDPTVLAHVPPNEALREKLEQHTTEELYVQLQKLDPKRASSLLEKGEQSHKRRIIRAIEVASSDITVQTPPLVQGFPLDKDLDVLWIGIRWNKEKLNERILERTLQRLDAGMVEEAERLHDDGLSWERMEQLGLEYKHLADYLRKRISREDLITLIDRDDRRYAKRQRTWFKRNEDIHWFEGCKTGGVMGLAEEFLAN